MSASDPRRLLVAYDIPTDARRSRLARVLESYGDRVQYSVFVVDAAPVKIGRLRRAMEAVFDPAADSILICDLGIARGVQEARFQYLGQQRTITDADSFVV